jgi:hypothetical protein
MPPGTIHFLEVNFTCSVFYEEGSEGSADHILKLDGIGQPPSSSGSSPRASRGTDGSTRRTRCAATGIAGYGIVATRPIAEGEVIFRGEQRAARIVTKRHVAANWNAADRELFRHYAVPLSDHVYVIWDEDPTSWAPQNHSCDANTTYIGLDVVAARDIPAGEELTLDYAELLDDQGASFSCRCGARYCRGEVRGAPGNSVTSREAGRGPTG